MFWRMTSLSSTSPVDTVLDKENFTLEELLDEEEIIQECKALNSRLINFLRDKAQVEQLLQYIVEEAPDGAENQRVFKYPFISCEIFTCEIDVILKTLVEEDELMDLLFSFLQPNCPHSTLLAGYFSKVVVCLMLRKTTPLMTYVQAHQEILCHLVDLIGITSMMEVLVRLVGADDNMFSNASDVMQWLADGNFLEMIVDKLSPSSTPEVHANTAETLCTIARNTSSVLASKLSSPSFVAKIFEHGLEDSQSKSALVHSLSVCICLLDPKRSASYSFMHSMQNHLYEPPSTVDPETIVSMLPKLGDLLRLLNVSSDEKVLPTTYGELRPPLGKHRLKIVEFIAVLLRTRNEMAEKELVSSGAIQNILNLFFEYPFNSALHHQVENIIVSCLETNNSAFIDHLIQDCDLVGKMIKADKNPILSADSNQATLPSAGRPAPRAGNIGHITRISNKLIQLRSGNSQIQAYLQENGEWVDWEANVLQGRNSFENVHHWACGRPTSLHERARDSDDDDLQDRDYDVATLANNLSQAFRYNMYENDGAEEIHESLERDDEEVYFDDESAEVVISSLRLGDDQESSLFTNSNWFAFQDERTSDEPVSTSVEKMEDINLNGGASNDSNSSDDEVVIGENEELVDSSASVNETPEASTSFSSGCHANEGETICHDDKASDSSSKGLSKNDTAGRVDQISAGPSSDSIGWQEPSASQVGASDWNPFNENDKPGVGTVPDAVKSASNSISNGQVEEPDDATSSEDPKNRSEGNENSPVAAAPSLFEKDAEFVGAELEGSEKANDQALKEGTVGEAGPLRQEVVVSQQ